MPSNPEELARVNEELRKASFEMPGGGSLHMEEEVSVGDTEPTEKPAMFNLNELMKEETSPDMPTPPSERPPDVADTNLSSG